MESLMKKEDRAKSRHVLAGATDGWGKPIEVNPYLVEAMRNRLAAEFKLNDKVKIDSNTTDVKEGIVIGTEHPFIYVLGGDQQHLLYEHELTVVVEDTNA
jgi:hypothetical protein